MVWYAKAVFLDSTNWKLSIENRQLEGDVAQLGERLVCNQQVGGSIPLVSTRCGNQNSFVEF